MPIVILHLGSNEGDRKRNIDKAYTSILETIGTIQSKSSYYETAPWGNENQQSFINTAIQVKTELTPFQLLESLQEIETEIGRIKTERWAPRIIDIDIIFYDSLKLMSSILMIPHPFYTERKFVLTPLNEIIPNYRGPKSQKTIAELNSMCTDEKEVKKLSFITPN